MNRKCLSFFFLALMVHFSCTSDLQPENEKVLVLGHRGSGGGVFDNRYLENTLPSIKHALNLTDGVEIDIQMSKDGTIWLYHDSELGFSCEGDDLELCVPQASDQQIEAFKICRQSVSDQLYKLEEVFKFIQHNHSDIFLSLDVKGYFTQQCFDQRNATQNYFDQMAVSLLNLLDKYPLHKNIIIETDYTYFLDRIKTPRPDIQCHLMSYSDFEKSLNRAVKKGYDGISFNLEDNSINKELIQKARKKGLKVQLWTVRDSLSFDKAISYEPFAIQTDYFPKQTN